MRIQLVSSAIEAAVTLAAAALMTFAGLEMAASVIAAQAPVVSTADVSATMPAQAADAHCG